MKVLVAGSTGFIGSEVVEALRSRGHQIVRLVRTADKLSEDSLLWDPEHHELNLDDFEGFDAVINLAGENIGSRRWTDEKKRKIRDSRVLTTHMLSELLIRLKNPPKLLINASAVGFYGDRGSEVVEEQAEGGHGFLAEVCKEWEEATEPAARQGIRVVILRFGVVLSPKGGVLGKVIIPFKLGLGGVVGTGEQYMSWIAMDDVVGIVLYVISDASVEGSINAVSPCPVTNKEFTKTLGQVLNRPTVIPLPKAVARFLLGEMADETLLSSVRAVPKKIQAHGYSFLYPELTSALKHLLEA